MLCGFCVGRSDTYGKFFPWSMPLQAFSDSGHNATMAVGFGVVGGLLVGALGLYDYLRRDSF